jgi:hypothetical protein
MADAASADANTTATITAKKIKGHVRVTGQPLVAAGENGWWWRISSSLSEC